MSTYCATSTVYNSIRCYFKPKIFLNRIQSALLSPSVNFTTTMYRQGKFDFPKRFKGQEKSVWVEYIDLALKYKPLNLGQGFPDFPGPSHVTQALADVANSSDPLMHQYTRGFGHPRLVNALAALYSKMIDRNIDPMKEVLVTCGAYEALYATIQGHIDRDDEAIIIEPFFDCYEPMVRGADGICRFIALKPSGNCQKDQSSADWVLDRDELAGLFNKRTKMIIINTPHNPIGKVFSMEELQYIAELCKKWDVLCISDEVYEWLVYKPKKHIRMASLPGMWERTITIGSAGKTFSATGWKIGWAYGPSDLMENLRMVHQNCVYTCSTPLQEALARGFEKEMESLFTDECYFQSLAKELEVKRDFTLQFLQDAGMNPVKPDGGYFIVADWSPLAPKINLDSETDPERDYRFTKWMTKNVGLQGIPPTAFYSKEHKHLGEDYVRYCFIKKDENLKKAAEILTKWSKSLK